MRFYSNVIKCHDKSGIRIRVYYKTNIRSTYVRTHPIGCKCRSRRTVSPSLLLFLHFCSEIPLVGKERS